MGYQLESGFNSSWCNYFMAKVRGATKDELMRILPAQKFTAMREKGRDLVLYNAEAEELGMALLPIDSFEGYFECFSNFYLKPVTVDGITFDTSEHAFQYFKTLDAYWQNQILNAPTPGQAKRLGKQCLMRPDWEDIKLDVMHKIVLAKFTQHHDIRIILLSTRSAEIIEGNTWGDKFWGMCNGVGQNHLGKTLMKVREELNGQ